MELQNYYIGIKKSTPDSISSNVGKLFQKTDNGYIQLGTVVDKVYSFEDIESDLRKGYLKGCDSLELLK